MTFFRPRRSLPLLVLGAAFLLQAFVTGCAREEVGSAPEGNPPPVAAEARSAPAASGIAITRAGLNPPAGATFTCWIKGSGFQSGDKVLVDGTTEIATTFGDSSLVTFVGGVELLKGRTTLSLAVFRPGTDLRSNAFDATVPAPVPGA